MAAATTTTTTTTTTTATTHSTSPSRGQSTAPTANKKRPQNHHRQYSQQHRPTPLTRRDTTVKSGQKSPSRRRSRDPLRRAEAESEDMTLGFHQYCAVCEKQIAAPNASVLYCSDSCRQRDSQASPMFSVFVNDTTDPSPARGFLAGYFDDAPVPDLIPQMSPTTHRRSVPFFHTPREPHAMSSSERSSSRDSTNTDETRSRRPSDEEHTSEAASFLRRLQATIPPARNGRASTSASMANLPSLSHTPTSSASTSVPYSPREDHFRPLPPRTNRRATSVSWYGGNIDLVTPVSNPPTVPSSLERRSLAKEGHSLDHGSSGSSGTTLHAYEKKDVSGRVTSPTASSLRQLFHFDKMRA